MPREDIGYAREYSDRQRKKLSARLAAWLRIARLQFYVMPRIAYSARTAAAHRAGPDFNTLGYVLRYSLLFLIEFATVRTNEYFDYDTDRINPNAGPFTGGSRILVEGALSFKKVKTAIFTSLALVFFAGALLLFCRGIASALSIPLLSLMVLFRTSVSPSTKTLDSGNR